MARSSGIGVGVVIGSDSFVSAFTDRPEIIRTPAVVRLADNALPLLGRPAEEADRAHPGSAFRDFTSRVGDPVPVVAQGGSRTGAQLVATAITCLLTANAASACVVAHPSAWTAHAVRELGSALRTSGSRVTLVTEAEAAYTALAVSREIPSHTTVLLCDVGSSAFDVALVSWPDGGNVRVDRPTRTNEFSGDLVDALLVEHVLTELAAANPGFDPRDRRNWNGIRALRARARLAKERLSRDVSAVIEVNLPGIQENRRIVRSELEALIAEPVARAVQRIADAADAAVRAGREIDSVVLTGGGSAIPLLAERVSATIGLPVISSAEPARTVLRGTTMIASRLAAKLPPVAAARLVSPPPAAPRIEPNAARIAAAPPAKRVAPPGAARVLPPAAARVLPPVPRPAVFDSGPAAIELPRVPAPPRTQADRPAPRGRRGPAAWLIAAVAVFTVAGGGIAVASDHSGSAAASAPGTSQAAGAPIHPVSTANGGGRH
ncbi:Hsp70 family protein [Nocardia sp. NBC_01327]|uniref:Hsp70 family protein n=1 Tax=Nocardia sp. NBC_01327 TaxID=2903593 RepID=UPI002E1539D7|nr:Hsp70 family protein [Nocardia sp. NBC_01327]